MEIRTRSINLNFSVPAWLAEAIQTAADERFATNRSALAKQVFVEHLKESGYGHLIPPQDQERPLPPAA